MCVCQYSSTETSITLDGGLKAVLLKWMLAKTYMFKTQKQQS